MSTTQIEVSNAPRICRRRHKSLWFTGFDAVLTRFFRVGRLVVIKPDGAVLRLGDLAVSDEEPDVVVRFTSRLAFVKTLIYTDLYLGEAYMDGSLLIQKGDIRDFLDLCGKNLILRPAKVSLWRTCLRRVATYVLEYNSGVASRRNVAHHYDLKNALFRAFLDNDMQYSCAYFSDGIETIDEAQAAKKDHIIAKLHLKSGQRVLDIGCGWGGLAMSIAMKGAVQTTAITLSEQQITVAKERAKERGLDHRIDFRLEDYRDLKGTFDRIVSVGMFEHVGRPNFQTFFDDIRDRLNDDGVALIHAIGRMDGPGVTYAWTRKYIFPGGYIPALSEVIPAVEKAGMWVTDIEILRLHYAETLHAWYDRFEENRESMKGLYDERFCRMWEFYLAGSEISFRYNGLMVFQIQVAKRLDSLPLTRNYMFEGGHACGRVEDPAPADSLD